MIASKYELEVTLCCLSMQHILSPCTCPVFIIISSAALGKMSAITYDRGVALSVSSSIFCVLKYEAQTHVSQKHRVNYLWLSTCYVQEKSSVHF